MNAPLFNETRSSTPVFSGSLWRRRLSVGLVGLTGLALLAACGHQETDTGRPEISDVEDAASLLRAHRTQRQVNAVSNSLGSLMRDPRVRACIRNAHEIWKQAKDACEPGDTTCTKAAKDEYRSAVQTCLEAGGEPLNPDDGILDDDFTGPLGPTSDYTGLASPGATFELVPDPEDPANTVLAVTGPGDVTAAPDFASAEFCTQSEAVSHFRAGFRLRRNAPQGSMLIGIVGSNNPSYWWYLNPGGGDMLLSDGETLFSGIPAAEWIDIEFDANREADQMTVTLHLTGSSNSNQRTISDWWTVKGLSPLQPMSCLVVAAPADTNETFYIDDVALEDIF